MLLMLSAADRGGLYRSRDLGDSWEKIPTPMADGRAFYAKSNVFERCSLYADPENPDRFGIASGRAGSGHLTEDGGRTWFAPTHYRDQPGRYIESRGVGFMSNDGFAFVRGQKERVFIRTWFELFGSDDGGRHFYCATQRRLGEHHYQTTGSDAQFVGAVTVDPANGFIYLQDDDVGIARSEDFGRTFHMLRYIVPEDKESDSGFAGRGVWNGNNGCNLVIDAAHEPSHVYSWFSALIPLPHEIEGRRRDYVVDRPNYRCGLYFSDDHGKLFRWRASYKTCPKRWMPLPQALVMDRNSPKDARALYIAVSGGIFASRDSGRTWLCLNDAIAKSLGLSLPGPCDYEAWRKRAACFARVRVDPRDGNILYVATLGRESDPDQTTRLPALIKSADQGRTWQALDCPVASCWAFEISPHDSKRLYAADGRKGVYFSEDGGRTWERRLPLDWVIGILPSSRDPALVYAAAFAGNRSNVKAGIWRSADHGATWRAITGSLPNICVMTLSENPRDPRWLYAGTRGGGAFMAYDFLPAPESHPAADIPEKETAK